jgi:SAM-dependent methyltransferase
LVGAITTAKTNQSFLIDALRNAADGRATARVLIPAAADYAVLAYVLHAYRSIAVDVSATVVDCCETPLMLNRWYAERLGIELETRCCDALDFTDPQSFDVVCAHNFLGRFEYDDRRRLLRLWYDLLRPGGRLVTTQRIRVGATSGSVRFSAGEAEEFRDRTERLAREYDGALAIAPGELAEAAHNYAVVKRSVGVNDPSLLIDPLLEAGFTLTYWDKGTNTERRDDRPSAPIHERDYRMRLIATREA